MTLARIDQLTSPPIIGQFYRVPCILGHWNDSEVLRWIPIVGPLHDDADHLNFPWSHWHVDGRFVRSEVGAFACRNKPIIKEHTRGEIQFNRRKCYRHSPELGFGFLKNQLKHRALREAYKDARMKCMKCPHRGFDLSTQPVVNGVVYCPGHALRWDVETGKQVMPC